MGFLEGLVQFLDLVFVGFAEALADEAPRGSCWCALACLRRR